MRHISGGHEFRPRGGLHHVYPFWVNESQFLPYIRSTNVWGKAMEGR